jgi:NAD(P)H dehydrogenase (quinone)
MRDPGTLERLMDGARAVYHICPNMHPQELSIGQAVIAAARRAGVEHLVYHSVLHPHVEAMPHHWQKMRVEEQLFASGLAYTILQPAAYMQNVLAHWERMVAEGVYPVPYAVETRLGMVDLADVARAAATVLCESGTRGPSTS